MVESSKELNVSCDENNKHHQLCRLCACCVENPTYIFGKESGVESLAVMINKCLPVTVNKSDNLPKQLCVTCVEQLNIVYNFSESCLRAEETLKNLANEKHFRAYMSMKNQEKDSDLSTEKSESLVCSLYECPLCCKGSMLIEEENVVSKDLELSVDKEPDKVPDSVEVLQKSDSKEKSSGSGATSWLVSQIQVNNKSETNWELQNEEKNPGNGSKTLFCRMCDKLCETFELGFEHSKTHTHLGLYSCMLCDLCFSNEEDLEFHFNCHRYDADLQLSIFLCGACGQEFKSENLCKEHNCFKQGTENYQKIFSCCEQEFASERSYFNHLKNHHKENEMLGCDICGKTFLRKSVLSSHYQTHFDADQRLQCNFCEAKFDNKDQLKEHLLTHKSETLYACEHCGREFAKQNALKKHSMCHNPTVSQTCYRCLTCNEIFASMLDGIQHAEDHVNSNNEVDTKGIEEILTYHVFVCEFCEKSFNSADSLVSHRSSHTGDMPFVCQNCALPFQTYQQLSSHRTSHKQVVNSECIKVAKMFVCEFCMKYFPTYSTLSLHFQRLHTTGFRCIYCNETFDSYSKITEHKKMHKKQFKTSGDKPKCFECEFCRKSFLTLSVLIKHRRMHTGEKPFICQFCGKGFSQSSGLNTHIKVHSDKRPYDCPLCSRTFKIKGDRDNHVKKHSGGRPYACDVCGKAFMTQHVFAQHRRIHTGERPHVCDTCGAAFRRSHVLTEHKRIHTGEKPHACHFCIKKYRQRGDLLKHMRTQHSSKLIKKESDRDREVGGKALQELHFSDMEVVIPTDNGAVKI